MSFDPVSMGLTALSLAGTGLSAFGTYRQGLAQSQGLQAQSGAVGHELQAYLLQLQGAQQQQAATIEAANFNAKVAMENARIARDQARAEATQISRNNLLRLGSFRAAAGASGVSASGSILDVIGDLVTQGELERQQALFIGELQARGHHQDAFLDSMRARHAHDASASAVLAGRAAVGAANYERQVLLNRAREARKAGALGAVTQALGGASQAVSIFGRNTA